MSNSATDPTFTFHVRPDVHVRRPEPTEDDYYAAWLLRVDHRLLRLAGLTSHDLPDWGTRDAFDAGMRVAEAVEAILEAAGGF